MGRLKTNRKINLNHTNVCEVRDFIIKLNKLNQRERVKYLKEISVRELAIIGEVILNIIHKNIPIEYNKFSLLKRVKKYLYLLTSKKNSNKIKRGVLSSIKGLHILSIIFPVVLDFLS